MRTFRLGLRLVCLSIAAGTFFWCYSAVRALPDTGSIEHIADRIARGEDYSRDILDGVERDAEVRARTTCDGRFLTDLLIIQAKLADSELGDGKLDLVDDTMARLGRTSSKLLHCVPTASMGWLGLYWVASIRDGFQTSDLLYLQRSYETGRRERWIEVRRNRLALAVLDQMKPDLQNMVLDEFVDLVRIADMDQTSNRFIRFNAETQRRLLLKIADLPWDLTWGFYRRLRRLGYEDVPHPGNPDRVDRPWIN